MIQDVETWDEYDNGASVQQPQQQGYIMHHQQMYQPPPPQAQMYHPQVHQQQMYHQPPQHMQPMPHQNYTQQPSVQVSRQFFRRPVHEQQQQQVQSQPRGGGGSGSSGGGGSGGGYDNNNASHVMEIEPHLVGRVIGKGGSNIRDIEGQFSVRVRVCKQKSIDCIKFHVNKFELTL